jgi:hypothetical protein
MLQEELQAGIDGGGVGMSPTEHIRKYGLNPTEEVLKGILLEGHQWRDQGARRVVYRETAHFWACEKCGFIMTLEREPSPEDTWGWPGNSTCDRILMEEAIG